MYGLLGYDTIWLRYNYLKICNLMVQKKKNRNIAMHITNKKLRFYIFTVGNLQNIFMEHDLYLIPQWFLA